MSTQVDRTALLLASLGHKKNIVCNFTVCLHALKPYYGSKAQMDTSRVHDTFEKCFDTFGSSTGRLKSVCRHWERT